MVVHVLPEENTSPVVRVEVHVESVHFAIATIVDNDSKAFGSSCAPSAIGLDSVKPCRVSGNVVIGCEIYTLSAFIVQRIEVAKGQRG